MRLEQLDAARRAGKVPDEAVVLTLVPLKPEATPDGVVVIELKEVPEDLRCLIDLHVIVAGTEAQQERALSLIDRALQFGARDVEGWIVDRDRWVSVQHNHRRYLGEAPPAW